MRKRNNCSGALERLTGGYKSPKDAEAQYYLGATLKAQGKDAEAYKLLYQAAWSQPWKGPTYFGLSEIATARGDFAAALDLVDRSLSANAANIQAQNLKAAVLRHMGRTDEALRVLASAAHDIDPVGRPIHGGAGLLPGALPSEIRPKRESKGAVSRPGRCRRERSSAECTHFGRFLLRPVPIAASPSSSGALFRRPRLPRTERACHGERGKKAGRRIESRSCGSAQAAGLSRVRAGSLPLPIPPSQR
jgi:tetratricopeptide (TPR) repeat protein